MTTSTENVSFNDNDVVIVSSARTPMGSFGGALSSISGPQLGSIAIKGALDRAKIDPKSVDEVYMGCALQAGVGQNPARQALIMSGIPNTCPATTVNKVCASGMKSVSIGMSTIKLGYNDTVVCGGMESMSRVPHYVQQLRFGCKFGDQTLKDGMLADGLNDAYDKCHMGTMAELCAETQKFRGKNKINLQLIVSTGDKK
eukprot:UN29654